MKMTRETRTLRPLFPDPKPPRRKNFIKENVRSLRKMEQLFHANNKSAKDSKQPSVRQTRLLNKSNSIEDEHIDEINERLHKLKTDDTPNQKFSSNHLKMRKKSAPVVTTKKTVLKRRCNGHREQLDSKDKTQRKLTAYSEGDVCDKTCHIDNKCSSKSRSQGIQTLDTQDLESLYSEGVIRYPSGRNKDKDLHESNQTTGKEEVIQQAETFDFSNRENSELDSPIGQMKKNKEHVSLASKLVSQLNNAAPPPSYRIGVVPKYIKERKEALKKEQLAKAAERHSDCPSGHIPLPDSERKETLGMLKKNYQEYVNELNMLPIRTDTLRSQNRKMEIEKQLVKLEEAIKVFSRPKVFVKIDS